MRRRRRRRTIVRSVCQDSSIASELPEEKRQFHFIARGKMATTIYMKDSSLTLVTHSLYNNSSDHNYLSENNKDNDRFVPFAAFC